MQKRAPELFARDVRRHLIENDTCCHGAHLTWFEDAYLAVNESRFDAERYAVERFNEIYSSVRFYHATRSEQPDFFKTNGIPLSDIDYLNKKAFEIFGEDDNVRSAIEELAEEGYADHSRGRVWACLDKTELQTYAGHYLKYGPEYIQAISAKLRRKNDLRSVGIPTLIGFDVDIADLRETDLCSVVRAAVAAIFNNWRGASRLDSVLNFGLSFRTPILPSQIKEISHPQPIGDYGY